MANRYWVGGTGNWNGTAGLNWSTTSGGLPGSAEPTASDDVFFDGASGANTITVATSTRPCKNLNFTGFTGTFAGSTAITCSGSLTLAAGMTASYTGTITFNATTSQTITSNGLHINCNLTFDGVSGTWTLQDDLFTGAGKTLTLTNGTFNANNFGVRAGLVKSANSNTRTLTMGSGLWRIADTGNNTVWDTSTTTGLTFNAGTGTIEFIGATSSGNTRTVSAGSLSLNHVLISGGASGSTTTLTNVNCNDFQITSAFVATLSNSAVTVRGSCEWGASGIYTAGSNVWTLAATSTGKTITSNGVTLDFPLTMNGTGGGWTLADALTLGATRTLTLTKGTFDANGKNVQAGLFASSNTNTRTITMGSGTWKLTGTGAISIWDTSTATGLTLTPNTAILELSGVTASTRTVTVGSFDFCSLKISGGSGPVTLTGITTLLDLTFGSAYTGTFANQTLTILGSLSNNGAATFTAGANAWTFGATSGTKTIASGGETFDFPFVFDGAGGTWQLSDALNIAARTLTLTNGTLDANDQSVTAGTFSSSNTNTREVKLGTGTWTLSDTGTPWDCGTATGLTVTRGASGTIKLTNATATFAGGSKTYRDLWFSGTGGTLTVTGSNTFADLKAAGPTTLKFTAGTTTHVTTWSVNGTAGNVVTLNSVTAASHDLVADGGALTGDYLTISHSHATPVGTWTAGAHSTDVTDNTGWFSYTTDGVGTSAGTSTATAAGKVTAKGAGTSAGLATATAASKAVVKASGTSAGTSTTTGAGKVVAKAAGTSASTSTTTAAGKITADGAGTSAGTSTTTAAGKITAKGAGTSAGLATTTAAGKITADGAGTSAGTSTTTAAGKITADGAGTSAGTSTTTAAGKITADGAGTSAGTSTTTAAGKITAKGAGTSAGTSTTTAAGKAVVKAVGTSAGTSTTTAAGKITADGAGTSAGLATATAAGKITADGAGTSAGSATAVAVGKITADGAGASAGTSTTTAAGKVTADGAGTSAGTSVSAADSAAVAAGVLAGTVVMGAAILGTAVATGDIGVTIVLTEVASSAAIVAAIVDGAIQMSLDGAGAAIAIGAPAVNIDVVLIPEISAIAAGVSDLVVFLTLFEGSGAEIVGAALLSLTLGFGGETVAVVEAAIDLEMIFDVAADLVVGGVFRPRILIGSGSIKRHVVGSGSVHALVVGSGSVRRKA